MSKRTFETCHDDELELLKMALIKAWASDSKMNGSFVNVRACCKPIFIANASAILQVEVEKVFTAPWITKPYHLLW